MTSQSFKLLAQSPHFVLGHEHEAVIVIERSTGIEAPAGDHYGDPSIGLITPDEKWFITAGEGLQCYSTHQGLLSFFRQGHPPLESGPDGTSWFVHSARLDGGSSVRILIDPWSKFASVWQLDLESKSLHRLTEGPFLAGAPFQAVVQY